MNRLIIIIFALVTLGIVNAMVWHKEQLIINGTRIALQLAPVDPRSIMQGDYMTLGYKMPDWLQDYKMRERIPRSGLLVVKRNPKNNLAQIVRVFGFDHLQKVHMKTQDKLKANEFLMRYRKGKWDRIIFGVNSFFFQEGHGKYYAKAKYADIRVDTNGEFILVDLLDEKLNSIKAITEENKPQGSS